MSIIEHMAMQPYLEGMVQLRQSVHGLGKLGQYCCFEEFVLQHGREYERAPLTQEQRRYVQACAKRYGCSMPVRQCYYNSQLLMLCGDDEHRFAYCEGFAWRHIPCMHGWLVLDGKHVVDTTWRLDKPMGKGALRDRALGDWNDERAYYGVTFSREYVQRYVLERKHGGSVIDDLKGDWPLMRGTPKEAWAA